MVPIHITFIHNHLFLCTLFERANCRVGQHNMLTFCTCVLVVTQMSYIVLAVISAPVPLSAQGAYYGKYGIYCIASPCILCIMRVNQGALNVITSS